MMKYKIKCYNCGNIDRFTIKEMSDLHFCQRCYKEHDTMCDVFANSVLELEKQIKRYREAIEDIKNVWKVTDTYQEYMDTINDIIDVLEDSEKM